MIKQFIFQNLGGGGIILRFNTGAGKLLEESSYNGNRFLPDKKLKSIYLYGDKYLTINDFEPTKNLLEIKFPIEDLSLIFDKLSTDICGNEIEIGCTYEDDSETVIYINVTPNIIENMEDYVIYISPGTWYYINIT